MQLVGACGAEDQLFVELLLAEAILLRASARPASMGLHPLPREFIMETVAPQGHKANTAQALDQVINRIGDYIRRHEGIDGREWSAEAKHVMEGMREAIDIERKTREEMDANLPRLYSRQDLSDIITTAIEGGIGYWAEVIAVERTTDGDPKCVRLFEHHEGDATEETADIHTITLNDIERAVRVVLLSHTDLNATIRAAILSGDAGNVDAEAADVLVQIAALGKIVYG